MLKATLALIFYHIHRMAQKGSQTANSGGFLGGLKQAFNEAAKIVRGEEQTTTYQPISTTTLPQGRSLTEQSLTLTRSPQMNSLTEQSLKPTITNQSLKPLIGGGKRKKRMRKTKKQMRKTKKRKTSHRLRR